jgi:hypothetical protein
MSVCHEGGIGGDRAWVLLGVRASSHRTERKSQDTRVETVRLGVTFVHIDPLVNGRLPWSILSRHSLALGWCVARCGTGWVW